MIKVAQFRFSKFQTDSHDSDCYKKKGSKFLQNEVDFPYPEEEEQFEEEVEEDQSDFFEEAGDGQDLGQWKPSSLADTNGSPLQLTESEQQRVQQSSRPKSRDIL